MAPGSLPDANDQRSYAIIGAAMEVHREMGHGFHEPVYHECLGIEMSERGIPFLHEASLAIRYKTHPLEIGYRPDFLCFSSIILEVKALSQLTTEHEAQVLNYLKASRMEIGLLVNFGAPSLQWKRLVLTRKPH